MVVATQQSSLGNRHQALWENDTVGLSTFRLFFFCFLTLMGLFLFSRFPTARDGPRTPDPFPPCVIFIHLFSLGESPRHNRAYMISRFETLQIIIPLVEFRESQFRVGENHSAFRLNLLVILCEIWTSNNICLAICCWYEMRHSIEKRWLTLIWICYRENNRRTSRPSIKRSMKSWSRSDFERDLDVVFHFLANTQHIGARTGTKCRWNLIFYLSRQLETTRPGISLGDDAL